MRISGNLVITRGAYHVSHWPLGITSTSIRIISKALAEEHHTDNTGTVSTYASVR